MAASVTDLSERRSVHVPKLKYRQSTLDVHAAETASFRSDQPSIPIISTPSTPSDAPISPGFSIPNSSFGSSSRRESVAPSTCTASSLAPPRTPTSNLKKGKGFLSSLFATKEPSAAALAQYEKQLRSQGTLKNGKISAIGMPGVSSARLPSDVPRVNSRWNGVPASAKETEKKEAELLQDRLSAHAKRAPSDQSLSSGSASSLRTSARRPSSKHSLSAASVYTTNSDRSRNQLADLYGWEIEGFATQDNATGPSPKATSVKSLPLVTSQGVATEHTEPPKIPQEYFEISVSQPTSPGPPAHSHSPSLTPKDESPATPIELSPRITIGTDSEKTLHDPHDATQDTIRTTTLDAPAKVDQVILNSSGVNILSPPVTAKRKSRQLLDSAAQEELKKEPKSILKKESSPSLSRTIQQPLSADPLYSKTGALDLAQHQAKEKLGLPFLGKPPGQSTETDGRVVTPTPEAGSLRRKSKLGVFGRRKSLDEQKLREYFETY